MMLGLLYLPGRPKWIATYESVVVPTRYIYPLIRANANCNQNHGYVGSGNVGGSGEWVQGQSTRH